jgi:hypothetical protein
MKKYFLSASLFLFFLFIPLAVQAEYITLYPADFVSLGYNDPYVQSASRIYVESGSSTNQFFIAPLHLPEGARITGVTVYYYDNSPKTLYAWIFREKLYDTQQLSSTVCTWSSSGASDSFRNSTTYNVDWSLNRVRNASAIFTVEIGFPNGGDGYNLRFICIKVRYRM